MGEERLVALIQESLAVATRTGAARPADFSKVIVDTIVQPRRWPFRPTPSSCIGRASGWRGWPGRRRPASPILPRVGKHALIPDPRTPRQADHARRRALRTIRTYLGRLTRAIVRKKKGDPLPVGIRLDSGALLIEFHPARPQEKFQILTPLAIAGGPRDEMGDGGCSSPHVHARCFPRAVAVTNRRLNQFVVLTEGQGVDITPADTSMVQKRWGEARVRALLSRFGE